MHHLLFLNNSAWYETSLTSTQIKDEYWPTMLYEDGPKPPIQWKLSVTTTSIIKFITCDLFSNVF